MTTNLDKLIDQQRALAKQIRDAKRAAAKREREALSRARRALGDRLSASMGATSPEAVAALGDLLDTESIRGYVATRLTAPERPERRERRETSLADDSVSASVAADYVRDANVVLDGDGDDYRA
jgi:hypothetical protein